MHRLDIGWVVSDLPAVLGSFVAKDEEMLRYPSRGGDESTQLRLGDLLLSDICSHPSFDRLPKVPGYAIVELKHFLGLLFSRRLGQHIESRLEEFPRLRM